MRCSREWIGLVNLLTGGKWVRRVILVTLVGSILGNSISWPDKRLGTLVLIVHEAKMRELFLNRIQGAKV